MIGNEYPENKLSISRDQDFPVFVIFFEGLMGPGGFVWVGSSSPWGCE
jgi:hypothetical protein